MLLSPDLIFKSKFLRVLHGNHKWPPSTIHQPPADLTGLPAMVVLHDSLGVHIPLNTNVFWKMKYWKCNYSNKAPRFPLTFFFLAPWYCPLQEPVIDGWRQQSGQLLDQHCAGQYLEETKFTNITQQARDGVHEQKLLACLEARTGVKRCCTDSQPTPAIDLSPNHLPMVSGQGQNPKAHPEQRTAPRSYVPVPENLQRSFSPEKKRKKKNTTFPGVTHPGLVRAGPGCGLPGALPPRWLPARVRGIPASRLHRPRSGRRQRVRTCRWSWTVCRSLGPVARGSPFIQLAFYGSTAANPRRSGPRHDSERDYKVQLRTACRHRGRPQRSRGRGGGQTKDRPEPETAPTSRGGGGGRREKSKF